MALSRVPGRPWESCLTEPCLQTEQHGESREQHLREQQHEGQSSQAVLRQHLCPLHGRHADPESRSRSGLCQGMQWWPLLLLTQLTGPASHGLSQVHPEEGAPLRHSGLHWNDLYPISFSLFPLATSSLRGHVPLSSFGSGRPVE